MTCDQAVSPVVAVVLLVALTVALASTTILIVDLEPDIEQASSFQQDTPPTTIPSYAILTHAYGPSTIDTTITVHGHYTLTVEDWSAREPLNVPCPVDEDVTITVQHRTFLFPCREVFDTTKDDTENHESCPFNTQELGLDRVLCEVEG